MPGWKADCVEAADAAIAGLAAALGRDLAKAESNADKTVRVFVLR